MIGSFVRWMRQVLPPRWVVMTLLGSLLVLHVGEWWLIWSVGGRDAWRPEVDAALRQNSELAAGVVAFIYGAFRVLAFHPVFRPEYRQWLELAPWNVRKPLPLGPVHLVPQDLIVLSGINVLTYGSPRLWVVVPAAFLVAYLGSLAFSFRLTGLWGTAYVMAFGFGLALRLSVWPVAALGVLCVLYAVALVGLRRSLERFPWDVAAWRHFLESSADELQVDGRTEPRLGWPYDLLRAQPAGRSIARHDGLLAPLLAGWLVWVGITLLDRFSPGDAEDFGRVLFVVPSIACIIGRLVIYLVYYWSPVSLWGRIMTGRWIIPDYDRVFVPPALSLTALVTVLILAEATQGSPALFFPLGTALVMFITLNMAPSFKQWQLTGNHRIVNMLPIGQNGSTLQARKTQRAEPGRVRS